MMLPSSKKAQLTKLAYLPIAVTCFMRMAEPAVACILNLASDSEAAAVRMKYDKLPT